MLILSERKLRDIIRQEFERFMGKPEPNPSVYSLKSATGAEIIIPNPIKEMFDERKVKSLKDII